jgi:hypothetical protein
MKVQPAAQSLATKRAEVEFHNFASLGEPERAVKVYREENSRRGGIIRKYAIYRAINAITDSNQPSLIGTVTWSNAPPPTTFTDSQVKNNVTYAYLVTAINDQDAQSGASNIVTIKK